MAVFDPVLAATTQTRQRLHLTLRVPHFQLLSVDPHLDLFADEPAGHRVGIAGDVNCAACVHTHLEPLASLQPPRRQRMQLRQFFGQPRLPARVELREQLAQESFILGPAAKVAAATQQQRLLQGPLELAVTLLAVAVLVGLAGLDRLALELIVPQQRLVTLGEGFGACRARRDRRCQPVGAVQLRYAAQLPQGVLESLTEALIALGEAESSGLPVGVGEYEVVEQVVEGHTVDGDPQVRAVGEVAGAQPTGLMHLGEEDFPGRAFESPPFLDASLECPQLAVVEATREATLEIGKQGFGLQSGVEPELFFELCPDVGESIRACAIIAVHRSHFAGQLAEPAILACSLGIHAGLVGGAFFGQAAEIESLESSHLLIGDHPEPPCGAGSG
jgi:hypothetical protein